MHYSEVQAHDVKFQMHDLKFQVHFQYFRRVIWIFRCRILNFICILWISMSSIQDSNPVPAANARPKCEMCDLKFQCRISPKISSLTLHLNSEIWNFFGPWGHKLYVKRMSIMLFIYVKWGELNCIDTIVTDPKYDFLQTASIELHNYLFILFFWKWQFLKNKQEVFFLKKKFPFWEGTAMAQGAQGPELSEGCVGDGEVERGGWTEVHVGMGHKGGGDTGIGAIGHLHAVPITIWLFCLNPPSAGTTG